MELPLALREHVFATLDAHMQYSANGTKEGTVCGYFSTRALRLGARGYYDCSELSVENVPKCLKHHSKIDEYSSITNPQPIAIPSHNAYSCAMSRIAAVQTGYDSRKFAKRWPCWWC